MPKMKYFQEIANIRQFYEWKIENFKFCQRYELETENKLDVGKTIEMIGAMDYLLGCQQGIAYGEKDYIKPSREFLKECFQSRLDYVVSNYSSKSILPKKSLKDRIDVCAYYLRKLDDEEWYDKLPEMVPTFNRKYPDRKYNTVGKE